VTDGRHPGQDDCARIEFEKFFRDNYPGLRRYVHAHWPRSDSGSIANEALERVWRNWKNIGGDKMAWAKVTAKRLAIDACRKHRELLLEPTEMNARMTSTEPTNDADRTRIRQAVEALPKRLEKAMTMHMWGYTNEDIARVLGCKVSSVSSYLSEARTLVAAQIGGRSRRRDRRTRAERSPRAENRAENPDSARDRGAAPSAAGRLPGHHHDDEED
jgi:RNA polymerase sigma factor (sigma-70 family)